MNIKAVYTQGNTFFGADTIRIFLNLRNTGRITSVANTLSMIVSSFNDVINLSY